MNDELLNVKKHIGKKGFTRNIWDLVMPLSGLLPVP
jgi:hypothetical protein